MSTPFDNRVLSDRFYRTPIIGPPDQVDRLQGSGHPSLRCSTAKDLFLQFGQTAEWRGPRLRWVDLWPAGRPH
jgi:hypothetical protein